jgi:hypothetical protein
MDRKRRRNRKRPDRDGWWPLIIRGMLIVVDWSLNGGGPRWW